MVYCVANKVDNTQKQMYNVRYNRVISLRVVETFHVCYFMLESHTIENECFIFRKHENFNLTKINKICSWSWLNICDIKGIYVFPLVGFPE